MKNLHRITINSESDVIRARMLTRQAAHDLGLPVIDQARISLATSSLAAALSLGKLTTGCIEIRLVNTPQRDCVEVVCTTENAVDTPTTLAKLRTAEWRQMVDEMNISFLSNTDLQVTVTKWLS
jgi:hypothetical protein